MRIKGIGVARIRNGEGCYLLWGQQEGTKLTLLPPHTVFEFLPDGLDGLIAVGATNLINGVDVHCDVPDAIITPIVEWFNRRKGRETSMLPRLLRTLVGINILDDSDRKGHSERFIHAGLNLPPGRRSVESPTVRLIDVFEVQFAPRTMEKLSAAARSRKSPLYFATEDELKAGITHRGVPISSLARTTLL